MSSQSGSEYGGANNRRKIKSVKKQKLEPLLEKKSRRVRKNTQQYDDS